MMNAKKLMIGLMAGTMIFGAAATTASAGFSFNFSSSESSSETTTVEDSQGNEYEVTHTIETVDGETREYYENVPLEIYNDTGEEITALYISDSESDTWGDNTLVADGEEVTLEDGGHVWGLTLGYNPNETLLDVKIEFADGRYVEFPDYSMADLEDGTHIDMKFSAEEDETYRIVLE